MENQDTSPLLKGYCPHCFESLSFSVAERRGKQINCPSCSEIFTIKEAEKIKLSKTIQGYCPHCSTQLKFTNRQRSGEVIECGNCHKDFVIADVEDVNQVAQVVYASSTSKDDLKNNSITTSEGRMNRSTFLVWWVVAVLLFVIGGYLVESYEEGEVIFGTLMLLFTIPFYWMVVIKRLHDLNYSGWVSLFQLVPIANVILLIVLLFQQGTTGRNRFGPEIR